MDKKLTKRGDEPCPQCAHIIKKTGEQCRKRAVRGATKCKTHGGGRQIAYRGPGNPNYKDGRSSKYRDHVLAGERYAIALADPDLMTNKHEIALLESLMHQTGDDLESIFDAKLWTEAESACNAFRIALKTKRVDKQIEAFSEIERIVALGQSGSGKVKSLREMMLERMRLVESQHKIEQALGTSMSAEQAVGLVMTISQAINDHVSSVQERNAVQAVLMRQLGAPIG